MDMLAKVAEAKEHRAAKIAVMADTTTMKDITSASQLGVPEAFRLRPRLLRLLAIHFDKHAERMP